MELGPYTLIIIILQMKQFWGERWRFSSTVAAGLLRSGDCGCRLSPVNSLSYIRNDTEFKMIRAL